MLIPTYRQNSKSPTVSKVKNTRVHDSKPVRCFLDDKYTTTRKERKEVSSSPSITITVKYKIMDSTIIFI